MLSVNIVGVLGVKPQEASPQKNSVLVGAVEN